jgi:hypothetical protein
MLVCKPKGRGNWHPVFIEVHTRGFDLFPPLRLRALRVGERIVVGDLVLRICEVRP